jgi:hypothetical protein
MVWGFHGPIWAANKTRGLLPTRTTISFNSGRLLTCHVHALPRILIPAGPVAATVDHALDGLDT